MFCRECGNELRDDARFCTGCGAAVKQNAPQQAAEQVPDWQPEPVPVENVYTAPQQEYSYQSYTEPQQDDPYQSYAAPQQKEGPAHNGKVSFVEAIKLFFVNYVNFEGRASRSEYWWVVLFNMILGLIVNLIQVPVINGIVSLALLIPGLALCVRRLHDTGKRWTYLLMGLIPIAGSIILIVQYCQDSVGDNQWGPGPNR